MAQVTSLVNAIRTNSKTEKPTVLSVVAQPTNELPNVKIKLLPTLVVDGIDTGVVQIEVNGIRYTHRNSFGNFLKLSDTPRSCKQNDVFTVNLQTLIFGSSSTGVHAEKTSQNLHAGDSEKWGANLPPISDIDFKEKITKTSETSKITNLQDISTPIHNSLLSQKEQDLEKLGVLSNSTLHDTTIEQNYDIPELKIIADTISKTTGRPSYNLSQSIWMTDREVRKLTLVSSTSFAKGFKEKILDIFEDYLKNNNHVNQEVILSPDIVNQLMDSLTILKEEYARLVKENLEIKQMNQTFMVMLGKMNDNLEALTHTSPKIINAINTPKSLRNYGLPDEHFKNDETRPSYTLSHLLTKYGYKETATELNERMAQCSIITRIKHQDNDSTFPVISDFLSREKFAYLVLTPNYNQPVGIRYYDDIFKSLYEYLFTYDIATNFLKVFEPSVTYAAFRSMMVEDGLGIISEGRLVLTRKGKMYGRQEGKNIKFNQAAFVMLIDDVLKITVPRSK